MKKLLAAFLFLTFWFSALKAQTLTVMSYNIHIGQNSGDEDQLKNIADFIKNSKADLVGLQEVDSMCYRSGKIDQMKFLSEHTGMHYAYARHFAFDGGSYGIGILSRYPLSDIKDHRIILTSAGQADAATRALLSASIFSGNKKLIFATVHMDYRSSVSREAQSAEMVKLFGQLSLPVILTGDFNARPGTRELVTLERMFTDISKLSGPTYPAIKPLNKIDYIMLDKGHTAKIKKQKAVAVDYSDHLPVMSGIKIKRI